MDKIYNISFGLVRYKLHELALTANTRASIANFDKTYSLSMTMMMIFKFIVTHPQTLTKKRIMYIQITTNMVKAHITSAFVCN